MWDACLSQLLALGSLLHWKGTQLTDTFSLTGSRHCHYSGGGFFLACEDFWRMFHCSLPACAFFFFLRWRLVHVHRFHTMTGSVHSSSVSWNDCGWMFLDKLCVSLSPDRSPTLCLDSSIVSPIQLHRVKGICMFKCNLPPALLAEWPGSFICRCGNTGVEWAPNNSQPTILTLEKKILPPLLWDLNLQPFDHESVAPTSKSSRLPVF